jgi:hypothetical protein
MAPELNSAARGIFDDFSELNDTDGRLNKILSQR